MKKISTTPDLFYSVFSKFINNTNSSRIQNWKKLFQVSKWKIGKFHLMSDILTYFNWNMFHIFQVDAYGYFLYPKELFVFKFQTWCCFEVPFPHDETSTSLYHIKNMKWLFTNKYEPLFLESSLCNTKCCFLLLLFCNSTPVFLMSNTSDVRIKRILFD